MFLWVFFCSCMCMSVGSGMAHAENPDSECNWVVSGKTENQILNRPLALNDWNLDMWQWLSQKALTGSKFGNRHLPLWIRGLHILESVQNLASCSHERSNVLSSHHSLQVDLSLDLSCQRVTASADTYQERHTMEIWEKAEQLHASSTVELNC